MNRSRFLFAFLVSMNVAHVAFALTATDDGSTAEPQQIYTNKPYHGLAAIHSVTDKEMSGNTMAPSVSTIANDPFTRNPKTFIGEINVDVPPDNKK
jgi:hypothetical protein